VPSTNVPTRDTLRSTSLFRPSLITITYLSIGTILDVQGCMLRHAHDRMLRDLRDEGNAACPTGKRVFSTRAEADYVAARTNETERALVHVYHCGFCAQFHIGHQRSHVW
jgi:hypothetical protein